MNKRLKVKDKVLQIRCTQEFLDALNELQQSFGMNRTEVIEFAIELFPALASQNKDGDDG